MGIQRDTEQRSGPCRRSNHGGVAGLVAPPPIGEPHSLPPALTVEGCRNASSGLDVDAILGRGSGIALCCDWAQSSPGPTKPVRAQSDRALRSFGRTDPPPSPIGSNSSRCTRTGRNKQRKEDANGGHEVLSRISLVEALRAERPGPTPRTPQRTRGFTISFILARSAMPKPENSARFFRVSGRSWKPIPDASLSRGFVAGQTHLPLN